MTEHKENALSSRFIKFGHRQIFLCEQGEGFPILMLHGGGPGASGLSNYSKNIGALAEKYRVLIPDMQGYGQSSKGVNRDDPFGDLADAMFGLLDQLKIKQVHIIGNSLGGACGLRMALEQPERVASLILMGPGGINTTKGLPTKGLNCLLNYYGGKGPSMDKLRTFIREYLVFDGSQVPESVIRERFQASIDPDVIAAPPLRRPTGLKGAIRMDFTRDSRLKKCKVPTLVVWGANDLVNRPSGALTLQKIMPNCDVYLFANTGHWVQWERADEFNQLSLDFFARQAIA
ncbi:alpha/beta fold hydrolase [Acinetobacter sp. ANC 4805]|uniref:alpha/beta fold hydrolase n=1 Tax=Acinetobacter sp. ANC 4805 TaxID=2923425 RepID=UPI001F4B366D|nr:alpha/beta fold hydrolase [Acinetobacter sp. ANC 4805]MCH7310443.1 alpha/beta fold hydrolase [Acinetobacter sp. ANC 4805]